jgi:Glycosyltransferase family 87
MRTLGRHLDRRRKVLPLVAGVLVALLAGAVLTATHHDARMAVAPRVAIDAVLRDPAAIRVRAGSHWNRITVTPVDQTLVHVSFLRHGQLVAEAAVDRAAHVLSPTNDRLIRVPYGNWIAYEPALLVALCALFALMTAVTPWRRLRNLDVAMALSLMTAVVLFEYRYLSASVVAAAPGMMYLLGRCAFIALGRAGRPAPSTPLLAALTPGVDPARRVRWLRGLLVLMMVVFAMVGVGSTNAVDVMYAVMEGATLLIHGVLPYGHMPPGVIHGDTYPILTYALYTPLALFEPVHSTWNSVYAGLAAAVAAAFVGGWAVYRIAAGPRRRFGEGRPGEGRPGEGRPGEVEEAGLRAALAWLAFPSLLITVSTGTTDVALGAMLAIAVLLWRRPALCAGMVAVAGWFKLAPFALLPVSLAPLRGRSLVRALAAIALVSVPMLALLFALGGLHGPEEMLHSMSYQFTRGSEQSVWSALGLDGLQPFSQGCVLGLIAAAVLKLRLEPELAHDRTRMAALVAAILIGLQLSADYWAFLYLAWIMPMAGVSLLADRGSAAELAEAPAPVRGVPAPAAAPSMAG